MTNPERYANMTHAEIIRLPKEEQKDAFLVNVEETMIHRDCRCERCHRRYSYTCLRKNAHLYKCPYCKDGS